MATGRGQVSGQSGRSRQAAGKVMPPLRFHHLGLACSNLDAETSWLEVLGYRREGADFVDSVQGVMGRFLTGPGPRLELLTEAEDSKALQPWLRKRVKIYHQAFLTTQISGRIKSLEQAGGRVVTGPVPAAAFAGSRICFVMLPGMHLVELIEENPE
jgi:methylmalonyl-CoA/ethylmalonyl-CoA epimerase